MVLLLAAVSVGEEAVRLVSYQYGGIFVNDAELAFCLAAGSLRNLPVV